MKIFKVVCYCPKKEKALRPKYLGDQRVDIAVTGRFHCQNCAATYEVVSDGYGRVKVRQIDDIKLIQISCKECEERYSRRFFLGNFQADIANQASYHCKSCNKTYRYTSDGNIAKSTVLVGRVDYPDDVVVSAMEVL